MSSFKDRVSGWLSHNALAGLAAIVTILVAAVGIYSVTSDALVQRMKPPVSARIIEAYPLTGETLATTENGRNGYSGGIKFRLIFSLDQAFDYATLSSIFLELSDVEDKGIIAEFSKALKRPSGSTYAGTPLVGHYQVRLTPTSAIGFLIDENNEGLPLAKPGHDLLRLSDGNRVVELIKTSDPQETIDIGVIVDVSQLSELTVNVSGLSSSGNFTFARHIGYFF